MKYNRDLIMSTQKQISISIEDCCNAIFEELNGEADPKRDEVVTAQCEKFNLNETFIKKLLFPGDQIDKRYSRGKHKREKPVKFLN